MATNFWVLTNEQKENNADYQHFLKRYNTAASLVSGKVIDAACGYGNGAVILAKKCDKVLAYDIDEEAISEAKKQCKEQNVLYICEDIDAKEWTPPKCDWLVTLETIEHIPHPVRFIQKALSVTRKGIVISSPFRGMSKHPPGDIIRFIPKELRKLMKGWGTKIVDERFGTKKTPRLYFLMAWEKSP
jgi:2-polyprenyl-3-methyl-5-hydroxy-6-metoxy-1,4-benzoquinol methylase